MTDPEKSLPEPWTTSGSQLSIRSERDVEKEMAGIEIEPEVAEKRINTAMSTETEEDNISVYRNDSTASETSSIHTQSRSPENKTEPVNLSRTTTVTVDAVIVPRNQRRGILARLSVLPEIENPIHYSRKTKWFITFITAFCAMAAPMGSAIVMPVLSEISRAFHATPTVANMSVAVYMLSMAIFPLWWSSFSERLGRRTIYIISFMLFAILGVLSAFSTTMTMLIVVRTLSGGAAASVQAVGAGTISDIWEPRERGQAVGIFYLGPLCGPLFSPIIGGALGSGFGWRSTQWFLVIYGGITLLFLIFCLPETLHRKQKPDASPVAQPTDLEQQREAKNTEISLQRTSTRASTIQKTKSFFAHLHSIFVAPLTIIVWLRFPPVLFTVYYASITFGCLYTLNIAIQETFSLPPYSFSTLILGLLYIPNSIGYISASIFGGRWIDAIMHREARKAGRYDARGKLILRPEDRMRENAWIAAFLYPVALIVYGWTSNYGVHWIVPMIANFFFGIGSMLIFALVNTMLTEFMPKRAASGIALNNLFRNIFSFTGAVVAEPALKGVGSGWLMTIVGIWSLVTGCMALFAMRRWGERWRAKMVEELG